MKINQIYDLINTVTKESIGGTAITAKDTSTLVALGQVVLATDDTKDAFYQKLVDRIGSTFVKYKELTSESWDSILKTPLEFGAILQKIQTKTIARAESNTSWGNQANPFAKEKDTTDIMVSLFSTRGVWELDKIIYDYQLDTAFTSAAAMGAFVSLIFTDMRNGMELALRDAKNMTISTAIATTFDKSSNANALTARNLLAEYNTAKSTTLKVADCMYDKEFLKFASKEINQQIKNLKDVSTLYNSYGAEKWDDASNVVVRVISDFATATASYLESDTYHKELVKLPNYTEQNFWQGQGKTNSFVEKSSINIAKQVADIPSAVAKSGIICFIHDVDKIGVSYDRIRTKSLYNPKSELTNYYHKADIGTYVDKAEVGVTFYVEDVA